MNKFIVAVASVVSTAAIVGGATLALTGNEASWKGTLNSSIAAAADGDTITVPAGTYPGETISPSSKEILVRAPDATFSGLTFTGVKNLTIDGINVTGTFFMRPFPVLGTVNNTSQLPENVVVQNAKLKVFLLRNAINVTLKDSSVGGQNVSTSGLSVPKIGGYTPATGTPYKPSKGIVIDNVLFHDIIRTVVGSTHAECLFIDGGTDGVIIRNSTFTNCGVFDIFGGPSSAGGIANVSIEGNLLDIPRDTIGAPAASAINFKGGNSNLVIKNNSILGIVRVDSAAYPGLLLQDNAIDNGTNPYNCSLVPASAFVSNTMTTACGGTGNILVTGTPFVSASRALCGPQPWDGSCYRNDLHVISGSDGVPVVVTPPPVTTETVPDPPPVTTVTDTTPVDSLPLTVMSQTNSTITLGWTSIDGIGYRFFKDGKIVSHTWDATRSFVKFSKGTSYKVESILLGPFGESP